MNSLSVTNRVRQGLHLLNCLLTSESSKSEVAVFAGVAVLGISVIDFILPTEVAASVLYCFPVFIIGVAFHWQVILLAVAATLGFSAVDSFTGPGSGVTDTAGWNYLLGATFICFGAAAGWLFRHLQSADSGRQERQVSWDILARFMDETLDFVCVGGLDGKYHEVNKTFADFLGRTSSELKSTDFMEFVHPDDRAMTEAAIQNVEKGSDVDQFVIRVLSADGTYRIVEWTCPAMTSGETVFFAAGRDVTEREKAAEAARLLSAIVESAEDAIITLSLEEEITSWNPAAERIFGLPAGEAVGQSIEIVVPSTGRDELQNLLDEARQGASCGRVEAEWQRNDGELLSVSLLGSPLCADDGEIVGISIIVKDLTEKRDSEKKLQQQEERLRHAQRMEAIGQLAGGVAHEYNNLLQAISGYTRFAQESIPPEAPAQDDLDSALSAADRAATLTRQLLNFSRQDTLRQSPTRVADIMADFTKLLRPCMPASIDLQIEVESEESILFADSNLLQQALMNLCVNGRDAMDSVGALKVSAKKFSMDEDTLPPNVNLDPGDYIRFSVADTGTGIPEHVRDQIFDPFFTTKEVGKGTGMGLATVFGVVQQHRGAVDLESEPNKGATFHIYLPLHPQEDEGLECPEETGMPRGGNELILVAEDDEMVRDVAVRILEDAGYRILIAENGEDAVEKFTEHTDEIDLLLFDVVMPKMGGREAAATIRLLQPDVAVAYCSGYNDSSNECRGEALTHPLIEKPFNARRLLTTVREALDRHVDETAANCELVK